MSPLLLRGGARACVCVCVNPQIATVKIKDEVEPKDCLKCSSNSKSVRFFCVVFFRDDDPLGSAIRQGDLKAFSDVAASAPHCLLRENKDGWMPLHDAAFCGQTECLQTILKGMASPLNPFPHQDSLHTVHLMLCFPAQLTQA